MLVAIFHLLLLQKVTETEWSEFADVIEECSPSAASQQGFSGSSDTWGSAAASTNVGATVAQSSCCGWQTGLPKKLEWSRDELHRRRTSREHSPSSSSSRRISDERTGDTACCSGTVSSCCNAIVLDGCSFISRVSLELFVTRPRMLSWSELNVTGRLRNTICVASVPDGSIIDTPFARHISATIRIL